ncbi:MAG: GIY-YIG nuclease family protein [bacterium]
MKKPTWFVYIVTCSDGTYYCGITTDLERRINEHNASAKGARYTCTRRPVKLAHLENASDRSQASKREYAIKQMSRGEKELLWMKK